MDKLLCPGCFIRIDATCERCPSCGEATWVEGRLALVEPLEKNRPGTLRGQLREPDGSLKEVAVKALDLGGIRDWRDYDRFRRQSQILESVTRPRLPKALGDFEVRGRVLHCQTLIPGRSLGRYLKGARLTQAEATGLAEQVLELLDLLHTRGIVHRDLKPDNLVLDDERSAYLVDFGAARRLDGKEVEAEPTVAGTPGYMAPQLRGEFHTQSDLFALGKVLEEALGSVKPEGPLKELIAKLTRDDWRKRPASAAEALAILRPPPQRRRALGWSLAGRPASRSRSGWAGSGLFSGTTSAPPPRSHRPRTRVSLALRSKTRRASW